MRRSGAWTCRPDAAWRTTPASLPRLQQVWARPLDAMAELEALLFRKSRGELFELPAYREVLFLYALARDLLDREAVDPQHVDLLLPLADGGEFSSTAPSPFMDCRPTAAPGAPRRTSARRRRWTWTCRRRRRRPASSTPRDEAPPATPRPLTSQPPRPAAYRRCSRSSASCSVSSRLAKHSLARPCSKPPS